jgi:ribosomal protein RSM22 (predicted rRNA methylase)
MRLPSALTEAALHVTAHIPNRLIHQAAIELSHQYLAAEEFSTALRSPAHRAAYLLTRMPATYAACCCVFRELKERVPEAEILSMLDLGAGPGTAAWAAAEIGLPLQQLSLIERDADILDLGKRIASYAAHGAIKTATWMMGDITENLPAGKKYGLVVASYLLGELTPPQQASLIIQAWQRTEKFLVLIEPGTPLGYQTMMKVRTALLDNDAHLVAPCPHEAECPLKCSATDWCHFAQRLERTAEHRRLKGGNLNYEDEKFCYLIFSREPHALVTSRILRHPLFNKGHVKMTLCTADGIAPHTVTKSKGGDYKLARKSEWGDGWEK